jgi:hypothetical protein
MSMNEDYNMIPEENFEELRSRLKSLPKAKAPENFTHNLLARIEHVESGEKGNVIELPKTVERTRPFWESFRPAYGIAAAIVIGFIVYELYPVAKRIQLQQSAPEIVQTIPQQQSIPKDVMIPPVTHSELRAAPAPKRESVAAVPRHDARRTEVASVANRVNEAKDTKSKADMQIQSAQAMMDAQTQIMQAAAQLPPDLFRQSRPPSGARLTTVSSGIIGIHPYDSMNAVDQSPWGAFNALQQGRDSLRARDSLKARRHNVKVK